MQATTVLNATSRSGEKEGQVMHKAVMARQQRVRLAPDRAAWTGFGG